jgi:XisH protein
MADLEQAVGQSSIYHDVLSRAEPERQLFLALNQEVYNNLFEEPIGELLLANHRIRLIVFDPHTETIRQWIPQNPIAG